MDIITCPTSRQIAELLRGETPEPLATELSEHINGCSRCSRSVSGLRASNVHVAQAGPVAGAGLANPFPKESIDLEADVTALSVPGSQRGRLDFLAPPLDEKEIGRLAHYRIFKVLGEGGMGVVLHAEDVHLKRPVALKVIKPEFNSDSETRQRFIREARAMAQIKSDHAVTVYQVDQDRDVCFIAMELLDGESLDSFIEREGKAPLSETLRIGKEISRALAAAHATGLIHRDIKPANVWLESPNGRVKLLDFGLARPQQTDVHLTGSGLVMGTPAYMAPEQARAKPLDARADLFALGCVLYRMSSGRLPFPGNTLLDIMVALFQETPKPPSYYSLGLPKELDELVMHLLEKNPGNRPESAHSVAARLDLIEEMLASEASPQGKQLERSETRYPPALSQKHHLSVPAMSGHASMTGASIFGTNAVRSREAEHRQVTVIICGCDLFASEDYIERLAADEQRELLTAFQRTCEQAIREFDGTIVQVSNDELVACFGYPAVYEDSALRAAKSALSILESLKQLEQSLTASHKLELGSWIVMNTGPALVELKDDTISLVGEAKNIAVRLKATVSPGQLICTQATHNLLYGSFESTNLGEHKIKSLSQPVTLFQIHTLLEETSSIRSVDPTQLTPLTGREHELSLLQARWEQACEGLGQVVHLVGEPGLGKSRLAHEIKQHVLRNENNASATLKAGAGTPLVVEWYGSPQFQNTALYPIRSFFQRLLRFGREESSETCCEKLIEHLARYSLALPDVVPLFTALLGLPAVDRFPSLTLSPLREREEMFRALKEWLLAYADGRPLLLVVEDMHWLDSSSLELVSQLLTECAQEPFLIVLTFRPECYTPWIQIGHHTSLALNHFTRAQVGEFLKNKVGKELPKLVVDLIYERAGGIPLFIEEFTRMVLESGALEQVDEDSTKLKAMLTEAIPATLQDLIMARLERMEGDRELAQFAATLGREFSYELISAAVGSEEQMLNDELSKLVHAEILYEKGRRPRSTFIFKNMLLKDALYNALIKSKRQHFHTVIVESIETRFPQIVQMQPELLAHHCSGANQTEKAIQYWLAAGLHSQELFANSEAVGHFSRGLQLIQQLPLTPERDILELSLLNALGPSYQAVFGYSAPPVGPIAVRARELCEKIGDKSRLFAVMWGYWTWNLVRAQLDLCLELTDEMMALANESGERGMLMEANVSRAVTAFYRGDFASCRKFCEEAIEQFEDEEQCRIWCNSTGQNSAIVARCYLSLALWHLGYADQARAMNNQMLSMARQLNHPFSLAHGLYFTGLLLYYCRLGADLERTAAEEVALAKMHGFSLWEATGIFQQATGRFLQDAEPNSVIRELEQGLVSFRALSGNLTVPAQICILLEAYIKSGNVAKLKDLLTEGLELCERNHDRAQESELHRKAGELAEFENDDTAAEANYKRAIEVARNQLCLPFQLRATVSLAKLWNRNCRQDEAREILDTFIGAFSEGFSMPEMAAAMELLRSF